MGSIRGFEAIDVVANPLAGFAAGFFFFLPAGIFVENQSVDVIGAGLENETWGYLFVP